MNIIVSGGRGFIGSHLVPALQSAGHTVSVWSRTPEQEKRPGVRAFHWDPVAGTPSAESLAGVDAVINLAGEPVAHKWSDDVKKKIRESRVLGTRHLVDAMATAGVKVLVCSSATGYYGDRGDEELTEQSAPGNSFLSGVCREWEAEADRASAFGVRVSRIRTGMVLGSGGGALARLVTAFKTKMGGKLGSGTQWMAWIHMADLTGLYRFCAERDVSGVFNGTAPNPVRNETFTEALGEAMGEPTKISIPEFALKMMFGEMSEVMLASQRVLPVAAQAAGYEFQFPEVGAAVKNALEAS